MTINISQQKSQTIRSIVELSELFSAPFHKVGDAIVVGDLASIEHHQSSFPDDPTGFEAFVNHFHLEDIFFGLISPVGTEREILVHIGMSLITVWGDRMRDILGERQALFYLGGQDTVALRFHIERQDGKPWIDLSNSGFLEQEQLNVFRVSRNGIMLIYGDI
jgi:hypothetical protein